ncbi:hypothetical protein MMMIC1C10_18460 [Methanococcus maripaludis]|uniref:hypothetical protein n=1 Tax=Methanococcus maripaludis TaxID=39152 RepID=UPI003142307B
MPGVQTCTLPICPFGIIFEWTYKLKMKINNSKVLPKVDPKIHEKLIYLSIFS